MPYTTIPAVRFGRAHQDMSNSILKVEEDGAILVSQADYSSEVLAVWRCANEASVEFLVHRFVYAIDSWHDTFAIGPVLKTTLKHQPANGDGDIDKQLVDEIEIGFAGWFVPPSLSEEDDTAEGKFFEDLDEAVEWMDRPLDLGKA